MSTTPLTNWLKQEMTYRGWDAKILAQRTSLTASTIEAVLNQNRIPDFDFCFQIADTLDKQPERLLNMAGMLSDLALSHALRLSRDEAISNGEFYKIRGELSLDERRLIIQCARRHGSQDSIYHLLQPAPQEFNKQERRQDRIRFGLWVILLIFVAIGGSILLGSILL